MKLVRLSFRYELIPVLTYPYYGGSEGSNTNKKESTHKKKENRNEKKKTQIKTKKTHIKEENTN